MLIIILKFSNIYISITFYQLPISISFAILIFSFKSIPILKCIYSKTMSLAYFIISFMSVAILIICCAKSMNLIIFKLAFTNNSIRKCLYTYSFFHLVTYLLIILAIRFIYQNLLNLIKETWLHIVASLILKHS